MRIFTSIDMLSEDYGEDDYPESPLRMEAVKNMLEEQDAEIYDYSELLDDESKDEEHFQEENHEKETWAEEDEIDMFLRGERPNETVTLEDHIKQAHSKRYIDELLERARSYKTLQEGIYGKDSRTALETARKAVALTLEGAFYIEKSKENAFALVRPPGHHAGRDYGHGFCLLNNAAIAARYLGRENEKVMIIDTDLHFGDGTADIVKGDFNIMYFSIHHEDGCLIEDKDFKGYDNIEYFRLKDGAGDVEYCRILKKRLMPLIKRYKPSFFVVSVGFDALNQDYGALRPGLGMRISDRSLTTLSKILGSKPTLYVLEGGYKAKSILEGFNAINKHI